MDQQIAELDRVVLTAGEANPQAQLLMTQPGVDPVTALAFVLTIGDVQPVSARQASSELSGIDSARILVGRKAAPRCDHQARQSLCAANTGGSRARRGALRRRVSQTVSTPLSPQAESDGESGSGTQACRTTTGSCEPIRSIRRSFPSRVARGYRWPKPGRRT